ncbi:MAG: protein kinase [Chloroflexi bacterium]|nr:protein kinase [Chloroflexota bacterium]
MEDLSGSQLSKYHLIDRVGRGGMSDVYRARDVTGGPEVAVKVMHVNADTNDVFLKRFEQEARIASGMRHPHILQTLDFGLDRHYPYMVTRLVTGGTLASILKRYGPVSPEQAGRWLAQVASALDYAHAQNVIHRDLKPTNILLDEKNDAFLTDFGIAKLDVPNSEGLTTTGNVIGTPTYMAPEQWRGEDPTPLTDVYGLGILMYLMMTAKPPFEADTPHSLMYKHLNDPPPPMRRHAQAITEALDMVIMKALAKSPADRYKSAGEFSQDFQRAMQNQPTLAQQNPPRFVKAEPQAALRDTNPGRVQLPAPNPSTPPLMPPPVYGPPQIYQQPAPQTYNQPYNYRPSGNSEPYYPQAVVQKIQSDKKKRGGQIRSCLWVFMLMGVIAGVAYVVSLDPDRWLPSEENTKSSQQIITPLPSLTPVPGEKAQVTILSPSNGSIFTVGSQVVISVTATDPISIKSVEMRRFGFELDSKTNDNPAPGGERTFTTEFIYIPKQPGRHILEFIPYQGNIQGNSTFLEIVVR